MTDIDFVDDSPVIRLSATARQIQRIEADIRELSYGRQKSLARRIAKRIAIVRVAAEREGYGARMDELESRLAAKGHAPSRAV